MNINKENKIWIISDSQPGDYNLDAIEEENLSGPVKEYKISELAWYLLNPEPIIIKDKLIGCNITYKKSGARRFKDKIFKFIVGKSKNPENKANETTREYISGSHVKTYTFIDPNLEEHFKNIYSALRPYDTLLRMLTQIDARTIHNITGVCEDIAGNRYRLDLQGSVGDKLNYIITNLLTYVKITMKKAYLSKGLFELRGFDFKSFNPAKSYRLIRYYKNGKTSFCVLGSDGKVSYFIPDSKLVYCMQLFKESLRTNQKLYDSVRLCVTGQAKPFKLFFTKQLEFSYSQNHLPKIFRNDYDITKMDPEAKSTIADKLNIQQRVISFNYIPHSPKGEEKMHTNISVMHDLRALEPLKSYFPNLFKKICKNAPASDAGKFYLLDSMRGAQDE